MFKFHAWIKKCHFGNFIRNRPIGWIWPALLVQPSISAHRKWPEMVESASTNQEWTKITIRSYAWSFSIQNQIEAVCSLSELVKEWMPNTVAIWPQTNFFPRIMGYSCKCKQHLLTLLHTFFQKLFSFCNGK